MTPNQEWEFRRDRRGFALLEVKLPHRPIRTFEQELRPGGFVFIDRRPPIIPNADNLARTAVEGHKTVKV